MKISFAGLLCSTNCEVAHNVTQMLWPNHCVINTTSAEFSTSLTRTPDDVIVRKGYNCDVRINYIFLFCSLLMY